MHSIFCQVFFSCPSYQLSSLEPLVTFCGDVFSDGSFPIVQIDVLTHLAVELGRIVSQYYSFFRMLFYPFALPRCTMPICRILFVSLVHGGLDVVADTAVVFPDFAVLSTIDAVKFRRILNDFLPLDSNLQSID